MNAAIMSAVAQTRLATFGQVPRGFRPLPVGGVPGGNTAGPHSSRTYRPQPGYGHSRGGAGTAIGRGRIVAGGVVRDSGTARTYPAPFVVHPTKLAGMGDGLMAPVDVTAKGNITSWSYTGPLIPLIGAALGGAFGAKVGGSVVKGGAIGAALGWFTTAGIIAATRAGGISFDGKAIGS